MDISSRCRWRLDDYIKKNFKDSVPCVIFQCVFPALCLPSAVSSQSWRMFTWHAAWWCCPPAEKQMGLYFCFCLFGHWCRYVWHYEHACLFVCSYVRQVKGETNDRQREFSKGKRICICNVSFFTSTMASQGQWCMLGTWILGFRQSSVCSAINLLCFGPPVCLLIHPFICPHTWSEGHVSLWPW